MEDLKPSHLSRISSPVTKHRPFLSAYSSTSALGMAPPSSPIISQMVADGFTPAMYMTAVHSSVCPLLSTRILSVVFSRCT